MWRTLVDAKPEVSSTSATLLLPQVLCWGYDEGVLWSRLLPLLVDTLRTVFVDPVADGTSSHEGLDDGSEGFTSHVDSRSDAGSVSSAASGAGRSGSGWISRAVAKLQGRSSKGDGHSDGGSVSTVDSDAKGGTAKQQASALLDGLVAAAPVLGLCVLLAQRDGRSCSSGYSVCVAEPGDLQFDLRSPGGPNPEDATSWEELLECRRSVLNAVLRGDVQVTQAAKRAPPLPPRRGGSVGASSALEPSSKPAWSSVPTGTATTIEWLSLRAVVRTLLAALVQGGALVSRKSQLGRAIHSKFCDAIAAICSPSAFGQEFGRVVVLPMLLPMLSLDVGSYLKPHGDKPHGPMVQILSALVDVDSGAERDTAVSGPDFSAAFTVEETGDWWNELPELAWARDLVAHSASDRTVSSVVALLGRAVIPSVQDATLGPLILKQLVGYVASNERSWTSDTGTPLLRELMACLVDPSYASADQRAQLVASFTEELLVDARPPVRRHALELVDTLAKLASPTEVSDALLPVLLRVIGDPSNSDEQQALAAKTVVILHGETMRLVQARAGKAVAKRIATAVVTLLDASPQSVILAILLALPAVVRHLLDGVAGPAEEPAVKLVHSAVVTLAERLFAAAHAGAEAAAQMREMLGASGTAADGDEEVKAALVAAVQQARKAAVQAVEPWPGASDEVDAMEMVAKALLECLRPYSAASTLAESSIAAAHKLLDDIGIFDSLYREMMASMFGYVLDEGDEDDTKVAEDGEAPTTVAAETKDKSSFLGGVRSSTTKAGSVFGRMAGSSRRGVSSLTTKMKKAGKKTLRRGHD